MNHLSYELCKQLKEAGFPQELDDLAPYYRKEAYRDVEVKYQNKLRISHGEEFQDSYYDIEDWDLFCYKIPTLSELIEACGKDFISLKQTPDGWIADGYKVEGKQWKYFGTGTYKIPDEAVTYLWLALNSKNK